MTTRHLTLIALSAALFLLHGEGFRVLAQEETVCDTLSLGFRSGKTELDMSYSGNWWRTFHFKNRYQARMAGLNVTDVRAVIYTGASPEGPVQQNHALSVGRGEAVSRFLQDSLGLAAGQIGIHDEGPRWEALEKAVAASAEPWRDTVLSILREPVTPGDNRWRDPREARLRSLYGGTVWTILMDRYFSLLRTVDAVICFRICPFSTESVESPEPKQEEPVSAAIEPEPAAEEPAHPLPVISTAPVRKPFLALTTNLLYDAAAIPNLGMELTLGGNWALTADWNYAWWKNTGRHLYWQTYGGYLGVRRYFGRVAHNRRFSGHYLGLYGDALTYDFELGGKGYQAARWGFGGGLEYGYSLPLSRYFNLDFSLGVGYQDGEYKTYEPRDGHYVWQGTYKRMWIGPTKIQIGLKWILGKQEKEGKR